MPASMTILGGHMIRIKGESLKEWNKKSKELQMGHIWLDSTTRNQGGQSEQKETN